MLGFKSFHAANVLAGIELMHLIRTDPFAIDGAGALFTDSILDVGATGLSSIIRDHSSLGEIRLPLNNCEKSASFYR